MVLASRRPGWRLGGRVPGVVDWTVEEFPSFEQWDTMWKIGRATQFASCMQSFPYLLSHFETIWLCSHVIIRSRSTAIESLRFSKGSCSGWTRIQPKAYRPDGRVSELRICTLASCRWVPWQLLDLQFFTEHRKCLCHRWIVKPKWNNKCFGNKEAATQIKIVIKDSVPLGGPFWPHYFMIPRSLQCIQLASYPYSDTSPPPNNSSIEMQNHT